MSDDTLNIGGSILIVEDDPGVLELEAQRLQPLGLAILRADTPSATIDTIRNSSPQLMLLDYSLPGMSALELLDRLREEGLTPPPFIMVTGHGDEKVAVEAMKAGAMEYIVKDAAFLENLLPIVKKAIHSAELQNRLKQAEEGQRKNLRLYNFLAQVNIAMVREKSKEKLFSEICEIAVTAGGFKMAWIGVLDTDIGRILPVCSAGALDGYLDGLKISVSEGPTSKGPTAMALNSGRIVKCADIATDPRMEPWRERALQRGYKSSAAIPITENGKTLAVINLYSAESGFFTGEESRLLEEIQGDISLALDAISAEAERAAAQAVLQRTASELSHLLETNPVTLFRMRPVGEDFIITWISGNIRAMLGYDEAEVLEPGWARRNLHPADAQRVLAGKAALAPGASPQDFRVKHKDNGYVWIHSQLKAISDEEVIGSWTDITPLKQSEERFQRLFREAPIGYQSLDTDGNLIAVNHAWSQTFGRTESEALGHNFGEFLTAESSKHFKENFPKLRQTGGADGVEFNITRPDGSRRRISLRSRVAHDGGGGFSQTHCVFTDITETWQARERMEMFSQALQCSFNEIYAFDPETFRFTYANEGALNNLGYSPEELLAMAPWDLKKEFTEASFRAKADLLITGTESSLNFESTHTRKDGTAYPVEIRLQLVKTGEKDVLLAVVNDITARKLAEEEISRQKTLFSEILDNSTSIIYAFDLEGRFLIANKAMARLFGTTPELLIGRTREGFVPADYRAEHEANDRKVVETGQPVFFEEATEGPQGKIWFYSTKYPLRDGQGRIYGISGISTDVTDKKISEELAALNEARLESLARINAYTPNDEQDLLDYALAEAVILTSSKLGYIYHYDEDAREFTLNTWSKDVMKECAVREPQTKYLLEKTGLWGEAVRQRKPIVINDFSAPDPLKKGLPQGHAELKSFMTVPIFTGDKIKGVIGVANKSGKYTDADIRQVTLLMDAVWKIAEKRMADQRMIKMIQDMSAMQRVESLGQLAGGIAHDFNNMLTGILANISMLQKRCAGDAESTELLAETIEAANSAKALTTSLLSFSKGGKPIKQEFCLERSLGEIFKLAVSGASASCKAVVPDDLWSVEGDRNQLEQSVNNLLINALQAMPDGGTLLLEAANLAVGTELPPQLSPGNYIRIRVSDTGIGIPAGYLSRIFEPYFSTKAKGHGLGLSMVWSVVKNHGGHITASSTPGKGSVFEIYLPSTGRCLKDEPQVKKTIEPGEGRILVLEDEEIVSRAVRRMLTDLGYSCEIVADGSDAVRRYGEEDKKGTPFAAVVMDLTIPGGMGGKAAIHELRRIAPKAKVVVSSGYSDEGVMSDYKANGFDAMLPKPYKYEELAEVLAELIGRERSDGKN